MQKTCPEAGREYFPAALQVVRCNQTTPKSRLCLHLTCTNLPHSVNALPGVKLQASGVEREAAASRLATSMATAE
jgi:hypothetical protein